MRDAEPPLRIEQTVDGRPQNRFHFLPAVGNQNAGFWPVTQHGGDCVIAGWQPQWWQGAEDGYFIGVKTNFLVRFAQGSMDDIAVSVVLTPARNRDLSGVAA